MRDRNFSALVILFLVFPLSAAPSETPETVNPPTRLLQFTIGLNRVQAPGLAGVTFAVYRDQEGGAPLWSETVRNITAVQYLLMPRLPAVAELAWSPASQRSWESFRRRVAAHGQRWNLLGINYNRDPAIPW